MEGQKDKEKLATELLQEISKRGDHTSDIRRARRATDAIELMRTNYEHVFLNNHPKRVAYLSVLIAQAMKLEPKVVRGVAISAVLHDAGKVHEDAQHYFRTGYLQYPESLRNRITILHQKLGPEVIKQIHLGPYEIYRDLVKIVASNHHAKFKDAPYLPRENWIVATADIWDALTSRLPSEESERGYREPMTVDQAARVLVELAHYGKTDPRVVDVFITSCLNLPLPPTFKALSKFDPTN